MKTFYEKVAHYQNLKQRSQFEKAETYYWKTIFPEVCQRVQSRSIQFHKKYDCLITLVGFSPAPIVLTILALESGFTLLLHTRETQTQLDLIIEKTGLKPSCFRSVPVSDAGTEDVYRIITGFIREYPRQKIAIDITGGKKSLVGSAAIAGALAGCDTFYVDFQEYDQERRSPIPGSEYLHFLSNPFEYFGDFELEKGKKLFNEGNYYAASQIFFDLIKKIPFNDKAIFFHALSRMFKAWEEYNFIEAYEACQQALLERQRCRIYQELSNLITEKKLILERLIDEDPFIIILNHYFISREMAQRNRYNFAALLLYRTLEMAFATRLSEKHQFDVNAPDYSVFSGDFNILEKFNAAGKVIHGKNYQEEALPSVLAFMNAYQLLLALDDPLVQAQHPNRVKGIAQLRNKSILAHGTGCIFEKQFLQIHECFLPIMNAFVAEYFEGQTLVDFQEKFAFFKIG